MQDFFPVIMLLLFVLPIIYMTDTAFAILRRNPSRKDNRLAALSVMIIAALLLVKCAEQLLPAAYASSISVYLIFPISIITANVSILLHIHLTAKYHSITWPVSIAATGVPLAAYLILMLLNDQDYFITGVEWFGYWKQAQYTPVMNIFVGYFGVASVFNIGISLLAKYRSTNRIERTKFNMLFKTNLYYMAAWAAALLFIYLIIPIVNISMSILSFFTLIWVILLRGYMKRDFLPSVERKYELLYRLSPTAIVMLDKQMQVKETNPSALRLFGYEKAEELKNHALSDFFPLEERFRIRNAYESSFPNDDWRDREFTIVDRLGRKRTILLNTEIMMEGEEWYVLAVIMDITKHKEEAELIHFLAHHDTLTKLPNRYHFNRELERSLETVKESKLLLGVMLVDLDRFKLINDTLGHQYGDEALIEIARRLNEKVDGRHLLARLGGDEFIILVRKAEEYDEIVLLAENIHQAFQQPVTLQGQDFYLGGSIGISVHPFDGDTSDGLIKKADIAMYNAKHNSGNQYRLYTNEMIAVVQRDVKLEKHLRKALQRNEFLLHYQPQMDLATDRLIGVEALIRWNSTELGLVHPGEFITLAEQTGLINEIGQWVIQEACRQGKVWQEMGIEDFMLSVNVSSRQLMQPDFVNKVQGILRSSGLNPASLCLEITESMVVNNINVARKMLEDLVALGIHIAIDDFGTGYSSLSVIRQLPISIIKIDRSFIMDMEADRGGQAIVKTIISMGHDMNKQVVAEGLETETQLMLLKQLGCDKAQGYYFHKPLPLVEFNNLLNKVCVDQKQWS